MDFFRDEEAEPITLDEPLREPGERIGRYQLIEPLGEGGFGIVYRAQQKEPFHRQVALKLVKPGMNSRVVLARFEAERQALVLLDHPNVARVLDAGMTEDGRPYFVMELVEGRTVTEHCARFGLQLEERLRLFLQICSGMEHAHAKGVIHRDLKPTNVMVTAPKEGEPARAVVIDFGIAKALWQELTPCTLYTSPRQMLGTPDYMSPEQAAGGGLDVDTRADVYSLGALLYEILTGRVPLERKNLAAAGLEECLRAIREVMPPRPSRHLFSINNVSQARRRVESELDWVVLRALSKERERRYQTVRELAEEVRRFLDHKPVQARPPTLTYLAGKYVRRHRTQTAAVLVAVLALLASTVVSWLAARQAAEAEARTRRSFSLADTATAHDRAEDMQVGRAAALLCRALRLDPENQEARFRLITLLAQGTSGVPNAPALQLEGTPADGRFLQQGGGLFMTVDANIPAVTFWYHQPGQRVKGLRTLSLEGRRLAHAFSNDDRRLVLLARNGDGVPMARVWEVAHGHALTPPWSLTTYDEADSDLPNAAAFSPDGARLFVVDKGGGVCCWQIEPLRQLWKVRLPAECLSLACAPDGGLLAVGRADETMSVLDCKDGAVMWSGKVARRPVKDVAFSLDGRLALATLGDSYISCVEVAERSFKKHHLEHHFNIRSWAFTEDGNHVLTGGIDGYVRLRPVQGGFINAARMMGAVTALDAAPCGLLAAAGTQEPKPGFEIISARQGIPIRPPVTLDREPSRLSFSTDGRQLLALTRSSTAHVFDVRQRRLWERKVQTESAIRRAGFLPNDAGAWALLEDGTLRRWQLPEGEPWFPALPTRTNAGAVQMMVADDGRLAALASSDGKVTCVDLAAWTLHEPEISFPVSKSVPMLTALNMDGGHLALATADGSLLRVHETRSGRLLREFTSLGLEITALALTTRADCVITGHAQGRLKFHQLADGSLREAAPILEDAAVASLTVSPDDSRVVSASTSPRLHVWDTASATELEVSRIRPARHSDDGLTEGQKTRFSRDGQEFFSYGSKDLRVRSYDADSVIQTGPFLQHLNPVTHVARSPEGELLLTADSANHVILWHMSRRQMASAPYALSARVVSLAFSPGGRYSLAAKENGEIRIWPVPPVRARALPECFLRFAEGFALWRLSSENVLQGVAWQQFEAARLQVLDLPDDATDPQLPWLKWLAEDPEKRADWPQ